MRHRHPAPSSTKNRSGGTRSRHASDAQGPAGALRVHIGLDSNQGHGHSLCTSAASVADKHMLPDLLHGEKRKVWGDGAYQGALVQGQ